MVEILEANGDIKVIGSARDGVEAISRSASLAPDVITMDIHMPRMDGLMAIERIMRTEPRPIVVVSSFVRSGSAGAIAALERGAVELVQKPSSEGISLDLREIGEELISKVRTAARIRVVRTARLPAISHERADSVPPPLPLKRSIGERVGDCVVAIGCSTGGPAALLQLARQWRGLVLPPLLVVQHLPADFTTELARQMGEYLGGVVREAVPGDHAVSGEVLIAPGGWQMSLDLGGAVQLQRGSPADRWMPSVDGLFESLARAYGRRALGVVLTGMGTDGTAGSASIRKAGGTVWVQDEDSSIIDGMPRSVREAGHASQVMSLTDVGGAIARRCLSPSAA